MSEAATHAPEAPPIRYRVSGMDCAKDAAQIERAAHGAGVAPDAVKVSAATHVMTLRADEADLPGIERAVAETGYGFERIGAGEEAAPAHQDPGYRRALWIVVGLNIGYGVVEMAGGVWAGSQALLADALDFVGDGAITFLGLMAIGWSSRLEGPLGPDPGGVPGPAGPRRDRDDGLARLHGCGARGRADGALRARRRWSVNVAAVLPLLRFREGDANMRAVWLFSRNDAIGNAAVVVAAGLVWWLGSAWPDLVVALAIAGLFLHSSWSIVRDARADLGTG